MFDNGCEWVRCDFHLHTHKDREFTYNGEENSFIKEYIDKLKKENIQIGIITNHNKFDLNEYKALKKKAKQQDILILPGVELTVASGGNGLHILIVFNEDSWIEQGTDHINTFITSAFQGICNPENSNTCSKYSLSDVFQKLDELNRDCFIILAHVDSNKGFFTEVSGQMRYSLISDPRFNKYILGFQKLVITPSDKVKQLFNREFAYVEGSDPKEIEEIGRGNSCYLKVGDLSFNSVKFALQDYPNRVSSSLPTHAHGYIKSISFKGGKLDEINIPLSKELNTLIGIRGSGKSSILECIRYSLSLEADTDKKYKDDLVNIMLSSGGKTTLTLVDKYGREYTVSRILGNNTTILDSSGQTMDISIESIINNPLYFGQKDLSFTKSNYELDLLEKLVGNDIESYDAKLKECITKIDDSIKKYLDLISKIDNIDELKKELNSLKNKINMFKEKEIDKKLHKQTEFNKDITKIKSSIKNLDTTFSPIEESLNNIDSSTYDLSSYNSSYNPQLFTNAQSCINKIQQSKEIIENEFKSIQSYINTLKLHAKELDTSSQKLEEEFANIKRDIQDDTLNPDEYLTYVEKKNKLQEDIESLEKKKAELDTIKSSIENGVSTRNDLLRKTFDNYKEKLDEINAKQNELNITITFKGDKHTFKDKLKDLFKGTGIKATKIKDISDNFSDYIDIVIDSLIDNSKELKKYLPENEVYKLNNHLKNKYHDILNNKCDNLVEIFYHGKLLREHSVGQRASALILFILSQDNNDVIIIDQPEDDLDNQVIYKEVISTIKKKKPSIQFIFATHNANIPVLGDAEQVITSQYDSKITVDIGNIDCQNSQKQIVDIMEGGRDAFERRKLIYNNWEYLDPKRKK